MMLTKRMAIKNKPRNIKNQVSCENLAKEGFQYNGMI
jgi:hypothetical protein